MDTPVLIVDDEQDAIRGCAFMLEDGGIAATVGCSDSREVMDLMAAHQPGAVVLDLFMPHVAGEDVLRELARQYPHVPVIIVTGVNEVDVAIRCLKAGAFDYLVKPVDEGRLVATVRKALEWRELDVEYAGFKSRVLNNRLEHPEAFEGIVTRNSRMLLLFQYVESIAPTTRPILITGETGTGKELFARAVHRLSGRGPDMVSVNVGGLDDHEFSDALFGHVRGAFTGADRARNGLVGSAANGTLFLDEIGDLSSSSQVKLLRLLQEREYFPLGADAAKSAAARTVVATNRDLKALKAGGDFRADLYFRLETHHVHIPPLRERLDDLPLLVDHFLDAAARALSKKKPTPPRELLPTLAAYGFPGNVRELEGMVFDAVSRHESRVLSLESLREHIAEHSGAALPDRQIASRGASRLTEWEHLPTLAEAPRLLIEEAMRRSGDNQTVAARLLGISRSGLCKALKRHGLPVEPV